MYLIAVVLVTLHVAKAEFDHSSSLENPVQPLPELSHYSTFKPQFYHGRLRKEISSSTDDTEGGHIPDLTIAFNVDENHYVLDLQQNRNLITDSYFERHQINGQHVVDKPSRKDIELCHYQGKLRGVPKSWAAVSTCNGLSGMLFDGKEVHYIEPASSIQSGAENSNGTHFLYRHSDVITNQTCDFIDSIDFRAAKELTFLELKVYKNSLLTNVFFHRLYGLGRVPKIVTPETIKKQAGLLEITMEEIIIKESEIINAGNVSFRDTHTGYSGIPQHVLEKKHLRFKREAKIIRGPYNANRKSRYIELILVVDNKIYKELGSNLAAVSLHCKKIVNIMNTIYAPLNIFIALIGLVVWTERDEISLHDGSLTIIKFLRYRKLHLIKEHPNDHAHLLTRVQFGGGMELNVFKGAMCTSKFSGGITIDLGRAVGLTAVQVAHQLGHNFGMEHDTPECKCSREHCVMSRSSPDGIVSPVEWSSCSLEYLVLAFEHGMDYCLRNKPKSLFFGPVCGNGFVETGEECDCGLKDSCNNPCCDADTCTFHYNATCATGECCDLQTCQIKAAGNECRSADHECDLAEFCTGQSEYCPDDVYKMDGEVCGQGKAFCYEGSCRTHSDQCHLLWGSSGKNSNWACYHLNTKGNRHGDCGYNMISNEYLQCTAEDIYCGRLQCSFLNKSLEFGLKSASILSYSTISAMGNSTACQTAIIDLGISDTDPGLVPNGAKCGDKKMCVNQRCVDADFLRMRYPSCAQNCSGNGVCNNLGHCHCKSGFAPPLCDKPGTGGSKDSGPVPSYIGKENEDSKGRGHVDEESQDTVPGTSKDTLSFSGAGLSIWRPWTTCASGFMLTMMMVMMWRR